jgi:hydroxysqualene synthase
VVTPALTAEAYAYCQRLAREHYENFPVASWLLPRAMRPHVAAVYAFARRADDFADEPGLDVTERLRLLDAWQMRLAALDAAADDGSGEDDLIFVALAHSAKACGLPRSLFADLLSAFRQDVLVKRYDTWADVLDYCRRSANPVGRLVLRIAGISDPAVDERSDAVCTALQLTNFWQDLERDWTIGRVYVPRSDLAAAGAREEDLDARVLTPAWHDVMRVMAARTRALFESGRTVCDAVRGRLRWELRATWLGGMRILEKLERARFDVFNQRPALGAGDVPALVARAVLWTPSRER